MQFEHRQRRCHLLSADSSRLPWSSKALRPESSSGALKGDIDSQGSVSSYTMLDRKTSKQMQAEIDTLTEQLAATLRLEIDELNQKALEGVAKH